MLCTGAWKCDRISAVDDGVAWRVAVVTAAGNRSAFFDGTFEIATMYDDYLLGMSENRTGNTGVV